MDGKEISQDRIQVCVFKPASERHQQSKD